MDRRGQWQSRKLALALALIAGTCWAGINVDESFSIYAKPNQPDTQGGKKVLADGGYYQFTLQVHADFAAEWQLVTETIRWTGPDSGFNGPDGSATATWQSPNDGNTYTVRATGKLRRNKAGAGTGDPVTFDANSEGTIYSPIIFWTGSTADVYIPERTQKDVDFSVEFWAKHGEDQEAIGSGGMTLRYDIVGGDLGGDGCAAQFEGGGISHEHQNVGPTSDGVVVTVTDQTTGGDQYCLSAQLFLGGTVNATIQPESNSKTIFVVAVDRIQWKEDGEWADLSGTLYARKGATLNFRAIVKPAGAQWPQDKPIWGGTAGTTGTEETSSATFGTTSSSTTDVKTVTAECGNTLTCDVLVIAVEITGFSVDPTWALGQGCDVAKHKSTCQAHILPSGASTLTYHVVPETAHGATIDAQTGIITPAADKSGEITVRVKAAVLPTCYSDANLLIRAHPTSVAGSSVQKIALPYYGGHWTHTFAGTGGTLEDVEVSECVVTPQPKPFGLPMNISPGPPNVWKLDAAGKMTHPDTYKIRISLVDANLFLPLSTQLPKTARDMQTYYWYCPLCSAWCPFTDAAAIDFVLDNAPGNNIVMKTNAYGTSCPPHDYGGRAVVTNLQVTPQAIPADGQAQAQGSATIVPASRMHTWLIPFAPLGATINSNTGVVTAGQQAGAILVRLLVVGHDGTDVTKDAILTLQEPQ